MRKLSDFPFCAETASEYQSDHFYTAPKMHFERNHNLIPLIDPEEYQLELFAHGKKDQNPVIISLNDLK